MIRRAFLAFLVFGLVGCGDDGVSPEDAIIGTWEFRRITGGSLAPQTWTFTATTLTIMATAGDCTIVSSYTLVDGTLTFTVTSRVGGSACVGAPVGTVAVFEATVTTDGLRLESDASTTQFGATLIFARVNEAVSKEARRPPPSFGGGRLLAPTPPAA